MAGRPFQKEVVYNKHLPYADKLDEEADGLFAEIKRNLTSAVLLRELRPGVLFWSNRLEKYEKKLINSRHLHMFVSDVVQSGVCELCPAGLQLLALILSRMCNE